MGRQIVGSWTVGGFDSILFCVFLKSEELIINIFDTYLSIFAIIFHASVIATNVSSRAKIIQRYEFGFTISYERLVKLILNYRLYST